MNEQLQLKDLDAVGVTVCNLNGVTKATFELIPIDWEADSDFRVDARDVHAFLGVGKDFSTWIAERIKSFEFVRGEDFEIVSQSPISGSGNRGAKIEYITTLDMAKDRLSLARPRGAVAGQE